MKPVINEASTWGMALKNNKRVVIYLGVPAHYLNLSPTQKSNTKIQHKNPTQKSNTKIQHKNPTQKSNTKIQIFLQHKKPAHYPNLYPTQKSNTKSYNHSLIIKSLFYIVKNNMKKNMNKYVTKKTLILYY